MQVLTYSGHPMTYGRGPALPFRPAVLHVLSKIMQELICVSRFRHGAFYGPIYF